METETRADRRIMLALRVVGPASERERGLLFGGLVEDRPREVDLPLFPELAPTDHRVPLLEIVDATGVPLRSRGRGAPIEAQLIVRGGEPDRRGHRDARSKTCREGADLVQGVIAAEGILSDTSRAPRFGWSPDNYWLAFFGEPSADGDWRWQFGGHHLAINVAVTGGSMSMSPSFIGIEPAATT